MIQRANVNERSLKFGQRVPIINQIFDMLSTLNQGSSCFVVLHDIKMWFNVVITLQGVLYQLVWHK